MCGIYGVIARRDGVELDPDWLDRMGRAVVHRGPDGAGSYVDSRAIIGMRRLAIIDVAGGQQPLVNEDGTVQVVCNGEVFNFRQLRSDLESAGHRFRSATDGEVIAHLYEDLGPRLVDRLDGMYGFAIWDAKRRRLLLVRDRLGIKPIYYWSDDKRFAFASEAKALLELPFVRCELDTNSLRDLLTFGYLPGERSMFGKIRRLSPASTMLIEGSRTQMQRYWRLAPGTDRSLTEDDWVEAVRAQMETAIAAQMVSDVPIGAFLSGGIDSSSIVALMAKHTSEPVRTFTVGFQGSSGSRIYDERPYAQRVAEHVGARHHEITLQPDIIHLLPQLIWHLDEPIADSALLTTYLVAKYARTDVKVILSGVGGDELFGGYPRYLGQHYGRLYNRIPLWLRRHVIPKVTQLLASDRHSFARNYIRYLKRFVEASDLELPERYRCYSQVFSCAQIQDLGIPAGTEPDALALAFADCTGEEPLRTLLEADLATQLPDDLLLLTDKMTMATSLECRVPLLDVGLVELSARMPESIKMRGGRLKYLMRRAVADLLPNDILSRGKRGFGAPIGAWLRDELAPVIRVLLSRSSVEKRGLFSWPAIRQLLAMHQQGRQDLTDHLMTLMTLELWCRIFLDGHPASEVAEAFAHTTVLDITRADAVSGMRPVQVRESERRESA